MSGLCVAWNPLTAPQAIVIKRQGKIAEPSRLGVEDIFQTSGRVGHLISRYPPKATAIKSSAKAKIG